MDINENMLFFCVRRENDKNDVIVFTFATFGNCKEPDAFSFYGDALRCFYKIVNGIEALFIFILLDVIFMKVRCILVMIF